ncbi:hypothetical protein GJ496_010962 [Pomphorhynchus laevis]|nr:hypothetical protein GJ496_010962 [Pomphorhynchus laevis]
MEKVRFPVTIVSVQDRCLLGLSLANELVILISGEIIDIKTIHAESENGSSEMGDLELRYLSAFEPTGPPENNFAARLKLLSDAKLLRLASQRIPWVLDDAV